MTLFTGLTQSGTEFWFAPPEVTFSHNPPGGIPIYLNISSFNDSATVTIDQPANVAFVPITVVLGPNASHQEDLSAFVASLETKPTDSILSTGLRIVATDTITAYYEVSNTNNADIFSLKGKSSLGQEFYIPLHKHDPFYNHATYSIPNLAYASFDIVATQNNTTVTIYSPVNVDGHAALTSFSIVLQQGETYSCGNSDTTLQFFPYLGTNEPIYSIPGNHPSGAVVISDKDIAITIKDDSNHNPSGGCYDLLGDQIVPVDITGTEYIAVKGQLNATGDESIFILATQNNTQVFLDGAVTPTATLVAGETYRYDMDYLTSSADNSVYIVTSKPAYITHVTGFGCEEGQAVLPPLGCAGSEQISIIRSSPEAFYLNLMVRSGFEDDFNVSGTGTATINASDFLTVPGTNGDWKAAQIQFNTTEIPVNQAHLISNDSAVFTLAIVNGGATTGCRYGYFSEYASEILLDPGPDMTVCANDTAQLAATISGGTSTGIWTTSGSGQFLPSDTDLNATYVPSPADISAGSVTLILTSTGNCTPIQDDMILTITTAPVIDAGTNISVCENNATVNLNGSVLISSGGIWSGGAGTYIPNNSLLATIYVPTAAEIAADLLALTVTSTGNGICNPVTDIVQIAFTDEPIVNAGTDQTTCANNATITLGGSVTGASGGTWSGGLGSFSPNVNALNADYTPTPGEIATGNVTLTLTSIGNGNCNPISDNITLTYTPEPTVNAGPDQTKCANNPIINLNGSVTVSTGGVWSGGLGVFSPNNTTLNATYTPTTAEIASGSISLTLTSTGNGDCLPVNDNIVINFTTAPTVNAGPDLTVCENNSNTSLTGSVTVATGGLWSGGTGSFSPSNTNLNTTYSPSPTELSTGSVTLTLTSAGNGTCNEVTDDVVITITDAPVVNAGTNQSACRNNADLTLNGSVTGALGGIWSGGAGTFSPNSNAVNATYSPTASELTVGSVVLTLTSTGNGTCNAVTDNVTLTYTNEPVVNAGPDQTKCANNASVSLNGTVTIASGAIWTGGLGVFSPSNTSLAPTYIPTAAEIASGSITLTLTSTGNGNCNTVSDDVVINFTASPTTDAGIDVSVCENNPDAILTGNVTIATGGLWSGGTGTFSPSNTNLTTTYTPSASELSAGSVTLTLTSAGNGTCNAVTDDVVITITDAPVVNAGTNLTACKNNADLALNGLVTNALGGIWSGGAGTFSPNSNAVNATYSPTASELTVGSVVLTLTSTGNGTCNAVTDNVTLTYTNEPVVNAGPDQTKCANNADISLSGTVTIASGVLWTGGLGVFSPSNTSLSPTYTPTVAEIASGTITLTLSSTGNGGCNTVTDDIVINFTASPTTDAGLDVIVCENNATVSLSGNITVASGGIWSGGGGVFSSGNTALIGTYIPSSTEISNGGLTLTLQSTGNGNCNAVTDNIVITIDDSPIANAGPNLTSCENNPSVNLAGIVQNASGGMWSGGGGTFNASTTDLNAVYTPSPSEIAAGTATLVLTSTGNGICAADADATTITITDPPVVNAGPDQTLCSNNADANLSGTVFISTGGQWSGGLGIFTPNNATLNAVYSPSAAEINAGSVTLTLTSTGNGTCNPESDDVTITFTPSPIADAGFDINVCENNADANLSGTIVNATGGQWSGGLGVFMPSNSNLNATYSPSSSEILAGIATLTLSTTGIGNCIVETDDVDVIISPNPTVNAGADQVVCVNNLTIGLSGSVSGITNTGVWTTSGTGTFVPNNTTLNASYIASPADSINGSITLTLTSTNNATCLAISDDLQITILPAGFASVGPDQTVCANNSTISLNGSISGGAVDGVWSTTGSGVFVPDATSLNTTYIPSAFDINNGTVSLTLTSNSCNMGSDNLVVSITPPPIVNAGPDTTVCASNLNVQLGGHISGATTTGIWTSSGTGSFSPSDTDLTPTYTASPADSANQGVTIYLTATNFGNCVAETDSLVLNIFPVGQVDAGTDQTLCANNADALMAGVISNGASTGIWTSSGTGLFVPSNTDLNATYISSPADIASGAVSLVLEATNSCNFASDFMLINYTPAPVVDAGPDLSICGTNLSVGVAGSVSIASGAIWSTSGTGTFTPNNTNLSVAYNASADDVINGTATLYLTTTGNGNCLAEVDSALVSISTGILIDAGLDQEVCSTADFALLQGQVSNGSSTGVWSTLGSGSFSPNDSLLGAQYHFSSADTTAGIVNLVLTSTNNGTCLTVTDTVEITFGDRVFVSAGIDQVICASNAQAPLEGFVSGGSITGVWQSLGAGVFVPNDSALNAIYIPSPSDSIAGVVNLVLSSTNDGDCLTDMDTVEIVIEPNSNVFVGGDQSICAEVDSIAVSAILTNATTGFWASTGTGEFRPSPFDINAYYDPSVFDIVDGNFKLFFTTNSEIACQPSSDTLEVNVIVPVIPGFENNESCEGFPLAFTDTTLVLTGTITDWLWQFGDGDSSVSQNPVHIFEDNGAYDVELKVRSSLGCEAKVINSVLIDPRPVANFSVTPLLAVINTPVIFTDLSSEGISYYWDFGNGTGIVTDKNSSYTYTIPGFYTVEHGVTSELGCSDSLIRVIEVREAEVFPPVLPTGFSPNNDGANDTLLVRGGPFLSVDMKIYNNWGNLIFESIDPSIGWDGTWKDRLVPVGDYLYIVEAVTIEGEHYLIQGSVSLIK